MSASVGKGVMGGGVPGRMTPGVGASVLFVPASTDAATRRVAVAMSCETFMVELIGER